MTKDARRILDRFSCRRRLGGEAIQKGRAVRACPSWLRWDRRGPPRMGRCTGALCRSSLPRSGHRLESDTEAASQEACSASVSDSSHAVSYTETKPRDEADHVGGQNAPVARY